MTDDANDAARAIADQVTAKIREVIDFANTNGFDIAIHMMMYPPGTKNVFIGQVELGVSEAQDGESTDLERGDGKTDRSVEGEGGGTSNV